MMSFAEATAIRPVGDGVFETTIPDGWQQGKGAFGGVVVGGLARALGSVEPSRALRSISATLVAPAMPGPSRIEVKELRRGGSMTFLEARLLQDGGLVAQATASFAEARAVPPFTMTTEQRERPPWTDVNAIVVGPPLGPVFAQHYEYRPMPPFPFTGATEARIRGFLRPGVLPDAYDVPALLGLADAWWPTLFPISTAPRYSATVGYTAQVLVDPKTIDPGEPLFHWAAGVASHDNLFVEMRELWAGDRPVVMNQQTFAALS